MVRCWRMRMSTQRKRLQSTTACGLTHRGLASLTAQTRWSCRRQESVRRRCSTSRRSSAQSLEEIWHYTLVSYCSVCVCVCMCVCVVCYISTACPIRLWCCNALWFICWFSCYINCLFAYLTCYLFTSLLIYLFQNIFCFQARCRRRQPNLAFVFVFIICCCIFLWIHVCFCCVRFSFSVRSQETGWEECLRNDLLCVWCNVKP